MNKKVYLLSLAVSFFFVGVATSFAQEPYKIGVPIGITGYLAHTAAFNKKINDMQGAEINKLGGINGHPLVLIYEDTASEDSKGLLAIKKLTVKDKVSALLCLGGTGLVMASASFVQEEGIPLMAQAGGTAIVKPVKKWIFKTPPLTTDAVEKSFEYMRKQGIRKIGIITAANPFGDEARTECERLASAFGIQVIATERFDSKDTDMSAQLTRIRSTEAQAISAWTVGIQPALIAKQRVQLGIKIPLFQSHGCADLDYLSVAGDAAEGNLMPTSGITMIADQLPDSHPQKGIAMQWNKKYGETINTMSAYAFDALQIILNAMKKAGSDRTALRDEIEKTKDYVGLSGVFTYSPSDHSGVSKKDLVMVRVKNGKYEWVKD